MQEKSKVTTEDIIETLKKNTEKVNVCINSKQIELPIHYNLMATESYVESYEVTKNCKEAFYVMLLDTIGISDDEYIKNIKIEDLRTINNDDLIRIGEIVIKQSKDLSLNYRNNKENSFYENFNIAILKEYEKYKKEIKKVTDAMIEPFEKIRKSLEITKGLCSNSVSTNIMNVKDRQNTDCRTGIDIIKELKPIGNPMNKLLKEQIGINKNIAKILLENQRENKIANEDTTKFNIKNYRIMIATLIVSAISAILTGISLLITFIGSK